MSEDLAIIHPTFGPFAAMPFVVAPPMETNDHLIRFADALPIANVLIQTPLDEECREFIAPLVKSIIQSQGFVLIECPATGVQFGLGQIRPDEMQKDPLSKEKVTQRVAYLVQFNEDTDPADLARWWQATDTCWFVYRGNIAMLPAILELADSEEALEDHREAVAYYEAMKETGGLDNLPEGSVTIPQVGLSETRVIIVGDAEKLRQKMEIVPYARFAFDTDLNPNPSNSASE